MDSIDPGPFMPSQEDLGRWLLASLRDYAIITVDGKYFVYFGPDKDVLRRAGFAFR